MGLESGEFFEISGLFLCPYCYNSLLTFLHNPELNIIIQSACFYKKEDKLLTYQEVMNADYETFCTKGVISSEQEDSSLFDANIMFPLNIEGRIYVQFLDEMSYSISILLSNEEIEQGIIPKKFIIKLVRCFFDTMQPLIGHVGVEQCVDGIQSIKDGSFLGVDNSYVCNNYFADFQLGKDICVEKLQFGIILRENSQTDMNFYDLISKRLTSSL